MREGKTPMNLAALPTRFRLTSLVTRAGDDQSWVTTATLFHERASLKVRWTLSRPDSRLRVHQLVSPRWRGEQPFVLVREGRSTTVGDTLFAPP